MTHADAAHVVDLARQDLAAALDHLGDHAMSGWLARGAIDHVTANAGLLAPEAWCLGFAAAYLAAGKLDRAVRYAALVLANVRPFLTRERTNDAC